MLSMPQNKDVFIDNSFNIEGDPVLPTARAALDPAAISAEFCRVPFFAGEDVSYTLAGIRVLRHKPGKRCLLEYRFDNPAGREATVLLGKIRARRSGKKQYRLQSSVWSEGFDKASSDGISVPEPIAHIATMNMWLQRKVAGQTLTALLDRPESLDLMPRVAQAAWKIHNTGFDIARTHTITDEVSILKQRMAELCRARPDMGKRVNALLENAMRLAMTVAEAPYRNIHRDYYPDQIIVSPGHRQISVIDFDLCCKGDPAVDLGNFAGHLVEHGVRYHDDPEALRRHRELLVASYLKNSGNDISRSIQVYTFLTLMRHISISFQMPGRNKYTSAILEACETLAMEYFP
jgi:hypothetical protein